MLDAYNVLPAGNSITQSWCQQDQGLHNITTSHYLSPLNLSLPRPYQLQTRWVNADFHFDNLGAGMLALFQVATIELWVDIMYSGINAVAPEQQPVLFHSPFMSLFFVSFLIIGSFLVLNLLVAITIEKVGGWVPRGWGLGVGGCGPRGRRGVDGGVEGPGVLASEGRRT